MKKEFWQGGVFACLATFFVVAFLIIVAEYANNKPTSVINDRGEVFEYVLIYTNGDTESYKVRQVKEYDSKIVLYVTEGAGLDKDQKPIAMPALTVTIQNKNAILKTVYETMKK